MASVCSAPAAIAVAPPSIGSPNSLVSTKHGAGAPSASVAVVAPIASFFPSCPREFEPHAQSSPSSRRATEWKRPAASALIGDLPAPPSHESGSAVGVGHERPLAEPSAAALPSCAASFEPKA